MSALPSLFGPILARQQQQQQQIDGTSDEGPASLVGLQDTSILSDDEHGVESESAFVAPTLTQPTKRKRKQRSKKKKNKAAAEASETLARPREASGSDATPSIPEANTAVSDADRPSVEINPLESTAVFELNSTPDTTITKAVPFQDEPNESFDVQLGNFHDIISPAMSDDDEGARFCRSILYAMFGLLLMYPVLASLFANLDGFDDSLALRYDGCLVIDQSRPAPLPYYVDWHRLSQIDRITAFLPEIPVIGGLKSLESIQSFIFSLTSPFTQAIYTPLDLTRTAPKLFTADWMSTYHSSIPPEPFSPLNASQLRSSLIVPTLRSFTSIPLHLSTHLELTTAFQLNAIQSLSLEGVGTISELRKPLHRLNYLRFTLNADSTIALLHRARRNPVSICHAGRKQISAAKLDVASQYVEVYSLGEFMLEISREDVERIRSIDETLALARTAQKEVAFELRHLKVSFSIPRLSDDNSSTKALIAESAKLVRTLGEDIDRARKTLGCEILERETAILTMGNEMLELRILTQRLGTKSQVLDAPDRVLKGREQKWSMFDQMMQRIEDGKVRCNVAAPGKGKEAAEERQKELRNMLQSSR